MCITSCSVSIHAPRAGRDWGRRTYSRRRKRFNPRAPCGARLVCRRIWSGIWSFNPRAPCGARPRRRVRGCSISRFNPRAPCGARPRMLYFSPSFSMFQSTRPVRGATQLIYTDAHGHPVSIHAPRAGRDPSHRPKPRCGNCFNPRAPCGARLAAPSSTLSTGTFQSTRPVRGATSG